MSLVLELQREALEGNTPTYDLLRKALYVAKKLKVLELETWILDEMNGYAGKESKIPDYRHVKGEIKAGPLKISFSADHSTTRLFTERKVEIPLVEIEHFLENGKNGQFFDYPARLVKILRTVQETQSEPTLYIPNSQFKKIIEAVKTLVLTWSFQLEQDGVLGEGMSFSEKEKDIAAKTTEKVINTIYNVGGNIQFQQNTSHSAQNNIMNTKMNMDVLKQLIGHVKQLSDEVNDTNIKAELQAEAIALEAQLNSPKPKLSIISETLKSVRNISEGITESAIATSIQHQISAHLKQIVM